MSTTVVISILIGLAIITIAAVAVLFFLANKNRSSEASIQQTNTNEKKAHIRRIEIVTRKLTNQVFAGSYHSAFKGRGMSFSEVREYQYGDDVRTIDWNVTARGGKPYIKVYDEERELTMMLLIDVSRSTLFGTQNEFKKEIIEIISGIFAFSAITNNDKVGVIFFSDKVEKYIPPQKGKTHILRIISEIDGFESTSKGTDIKSALHFFNNVNKKKSIAFIISDFISERNFEKELAVVARKHDFIGIQVFDKFEELMEDAGLIMMQDNETGQSMYVNTSDKSIHKQAKSAFEKRQKETKNLFQKSGAQFVSIATTDNYVKSLIQMFQERGSRR